jgi:hypothetical protein
VINIFLLLVGALIVFMAYRHGIKHGAGICYDTYVIPLARALDRIGEAAHEGADRLYLANVADGALKELRKNIDEGK